MSRFTRPPFKKLSPYDVVNSKTYHPLSPPETDVTADSTAFDHSREIHNPDAAMEASNFYSKVDAVDAFAPHVPMPVPEPGGKYRRPSNLQYHSSSSIRSDYQLQRPRSATRWLVMVIPPPAIAQEHGSGVLLNGPARANHGILLPLFSNMSGQLTAIAREFGFPSTAGICVYLHMVDNGLEFTPRISGESWSLLWGHIFEDRHGSHQTSALPIAGRIEFDLDLRQARWYDVWVSNCRRESSGPSPPMTLAFGHGREESRTTTEFLPESLAEDASMHIQRRVPIIRHIPRKLSLLDRIDIAPINVTSRPVSRVALSPVEVEQLPMPIAVPNVMHEEDQTPRGRSISRVDDKVETWRASSSFAKSPLTRSHGQTALDPANMPNNMPLPDVGFHAHGDMEGEEGEELPLNLEDYAWSVSSAGPPSADFLLTDSPIEWRYGRGRAQSVHLDARLQGSVCMTASTCTSFGPPDYNHFDYAPSLISRQPSPDIAARAISDCPPTPTTATSWGAPSVWPDSPLESFRAPSVDIAARFLHSRPVTPGTATSWGAPLDWPPSPAARSFVLTPGVGQMFFDDDYEEDELLKQGRQTRGMEMEVESDHVWRHVWPYVKYAESYASDCAVDEPVCPPAELRANGIATRPSYPYIVIYPAVYPNFDLYPAKSASIGLRRDVNVHLGSTYPRMSIYPAVYPAFEIYPGHIVKPQTNGQEGIGMRPSHVYSNISSCECIELRGNDTATSVPNYPYIVIYPAVYPNFDLYPTKSASLGLNRDVNVHLSPSYPVMSVYPAVYPAFEIYPGHIVAPRAKRQEGARVRLSPACPNKCIRESIELEQHENATATSSSSYPYIVIYPAVYPNFDLYPVKPASVDLIREVNVHLNPAYPLMSIYPAVYPAFEIYPGHIVEPQTNRQECIRVHLSPTYPNICIYEPVYPNLVIYPGIKF